MAIINSLLDNDLYKFSMCQTVYHQFTNVQVEYNFKCRNKANWTRKHVHKIRKEIIHYCSLRFTEEELQFLSTLNFIKEDFIDFLRLYQPNNNHVYIWLDDENELNIYIKGSWLLTILFEVPLLAIVNEIYFIQNMTYKEIESAFVDGYNRLVNKFTLEYCSIPFAEFGTRRRFSYKWQEEVLKRLIQIPGFIGTSNVYFAMKYKLKPIGTMAHEFIMAGAGLNNTPLRNSQSYMLQAWVNEYRGDLGIALTDTYGIDAFLRDFDLYFAKLYDGLRHDSGDPLEWANKVIEHYKNLGIDPKSKQLIFSDSLTIKKAKIIYDQLKDKAKISFGIGTHLTNDFDNIVPLQIVIKMTKCNGKPVAKISDSPGKGMCNDELFLSYVKQVFQIKDVNDE